MDQRVAHGECFIPASNYANVLGVSNVCVRPPPPMRFAGSFIPLSKYGVTQSREVNLPR